MKKEMDPAKLIKQISFPIKREGLKNPVGKDTGMDCIWRTDTGQNLGVVSREYTLIEHKEAIPRVLEELRSELKELELTNYSVTENGARVSASFKFAEGSFIGKKEVGDIVFPGARICNSYDRTASFNLEGFIYRLVFKNGMISKESMFGVTRRYKGNLQIEPMVNEFIKNLPNFFKEIVPKLNRMTREIVSGEMLEACLNSLPVVIQKESVEYLKEKNLITMSDESLRMTRAITFWELLNCFSYICTHHQRFSLFSFISSTFHI